MKVTIDMAKTIKDMAYEQFPDHPTNYELYRCRRLKRVGFERGANAVIKEIENILDAPISYVVESGWQGQLNDICGMIRQRINELKGR